MPQPQVQPAAADERRGRGGSDSFPSFWSKSSPSIFVWWRLKQPGGRVFPNRRPRSFITQVSVLFGSSPPGSSGGGVRYARKTLQ